MSGYKFVIAVWVHSKGLKKGQGLELLSEFKLHRTMNSEIQDLIFGVRSSDVGVMFPIRW